MRNEGGGFAAIDDEVAAVLAFVISHTTFLAAQDDEKGRCSLEMSDVFSYFGLLVFSPFIPIFKLLICTTKTPLRLREAAFCDDVCDSASREMGRV